MFLIRGRRYRVGLAPMQTCTNPGASVEERCQLELEVDSAAALSRSRVCSIVTWL